MVAQSAMCCYCSHSLSPPCKSTCCFNSNFSAHYNYFFFALLLLLLFFRLFFLSLFQFLFKICSHSSETSNKSMLKVSNNKSAYAATKIKANTIVLSGFVNRFD